MSPSLWTSSLGAVELGMCHTLNLHQDLEADCHHGGLLFGLDPNLNYRVYIHDPRYFHFLSNPLGRFQHTELYSD